MSEPSYLCSQCNQACEPDVMPDIDKSGDVIPSCHRRAEVLNADGSPLTDDQQRDIVEQYWKDADILDAENRGRAWRGLEE